MAVSLARDKLKTESYMRNGVPSDTMSGFLDIIDGNSDMRKHSEVVDDQY